MKIHELEYHNKATGWHLIKTRLLDLTLFVGVSGVGKTEILKTILTLEGICFGQHEHVLNGVTWDVLFATQDKTVYRWTGKYEYIRDVSQYRSIRNRNSNHEIPDFGGSLQIPKLEDERLSKEDTLIFQRNASHVEFNIDNALQTFPGISPYKSVLSLFTEQEDILPVLQSFKRIELFEPPETIYSVRGVSDMLHNAQKHEMTLEQIRQSAKLPIGKLFLTYIHVPDVFHRVKDDFINVFPSVRDIRFAINQEDFLNLQIREHGTDWIPEEQISSGMLTTLTHLAQMRLIADGSVMLIDEFENSLGVNCLDVVADILLSKERDLQYIITSHHPYIVNNIPMEYWKIVTRTGSAVSTRSAADLHLGKSKHEAFLQLINSEEFTEGIRAS